MADTKFRAPILTLIFVVSKTVKSSVSFDLSILFNYKPSPILAHRSVLLFLCLLVGASTSIGKYRCPEDGSRKCEKAICYQIAPLIHHCLCHIGYQGAGGNCFDIDECSTANKWLLGEKCFNTDGSYEIVCLQGYVKINNTCQDCESFAGFCLIIKTFLSINLRNQIGYFHVILEIVTAWNGIWNSSFRVFLYDQRQVWRIEGYKFSVLIL
ncbi:predicted protein [Nematostella vectensis]|uniref:EGF-like calcium-binding domain-containing protein n=1 Tax=Nematostella vectensis TaxID=45351 RepID=A7S959_NEMVE|nr:predicted protein [Nematostella vectensis]|eukprot:XP_001631838.1 predicted protein [Nematostella vectensis]